MINSEHKPNGCTSAGILPMQCSMLGVHATSCRSIEKQLLGLYLFFEAAEQLPTKEAKL